jgi:hypothetical protein
VNLKWVKKGVFDVDDPVFAEAALTIRKDEGQKQWTICTPHGPLCIQWGEGLAITSAGDAVYKSEEQSEHGNPNYTEFTRTLFRFKTAKEAAYYLYRMRDDWERYCRFNAEKRLAVIVKPFNPAVQLPEVFHKPVVGIPLTGVQLVKIKDGEYAVIPGAFFRGTMFRGYPLFFSVYKLADRHWHARAYVYEGGGWRQMDIRSYNPSWDRMGIWVRQTRVEMMGYVKDLMVRILNTQEDETHVERLYTEYADFGGQRQHRLVLRRFPRALPKAATGRPTPDEDVTCQPMLDNEENIFLKLWRWFTN